MSSTLDSVLNEEISLGDIDFDEIDSIVADLHSDKESDDILNTLGVTVPAVEHLNQMNYVFSPLQLVKVDDIDTKGCESVEVKGVKVRDLHNVPVKKTQSALTPAEIDAFQELEDQLVTNYEFNANGCNGTPSQANAEESSKSNAVQASALMIEPGTECLSVKSFRKRSYNEMDGNNLVAPNFSTKTVKCNFESVSTKEPHCVSESSSISSQDYQFGQSVKYSLIDTDCESISHESGTSVLPSDIFSKKLKEIQRDKKRKQKLESGLSGSYWQVDNDDASTWAVRPRRSRAESVLKSITESEADEDGMDGSTLRAGKSVGRRHINKVLRPTRVTLQFSKSERSKLFNTENQQTKEQVSKMYMKKRADRYKPKTTFRRLRRKADMPDTLNEDSGGNLELITEELSCLCVMAIPQGILPTSHESFFQKFRETSGRLAIKGLKPYPETGREMPNSRLQRPIKSERKRVKLRHKPANEKAVSKTVEITAALKYNDSVVSDEEKPCCSKSIRYEFDREPIVAVPSESSKEKENIFLVSSRTPVARIYKRWEEDDVPEVITLGNNRLLINNKLIHINYTDFTTESDIIIHLDPDHFDDERTIKPVQSSTEVSCLLPHCRLGCVCDSIRAEEVERQHCGRPKCFFECCCLFKSLPPIGNDSDIRSRLRPRVSLLNWKNLGRIGNEALDHDSVKGKAPAVLKKHAPLSVLIATSNRARRNVQPPSRLRNEFVMDEVKRPSAATGKCLQLQKSEIHSRNSNFKDKFDIKNNDNPIVHRPVILEDTGVLSFSNLSASSKELKYKQLRDWRFGKSIISARYLYNHSLLRRIHKCRPCFIRLTRIKNNELASTTVHKRQVAVKSTSKRSENLVRTVSYQDEGTSASHQILPPEVADSLFAMEVRERNTFVIARTNGTILAFLYWSQRKKCVPTARKYLPEAGEVGSYPWLKLPLPPLDQAWMFYELPEHFRNTQHILIPELNVMLRTDMLSVRLEETEAHGKTQKLDVGDFLTTVRKNKYGAIYIVKDLPNILVCGPFRKKKLRPVSRCVLKEAVSLLYYYVRKYPNIHTLRPKTLYVGPEELTAMSMIEIDNLGRDWDLIPPEVMMRHYKDFMIPVNKTARSLRASRASYERQFEFGFDLDHMFGTERSCSPSDLVTELEDPHTEDIKKYGDMEDKTWREVASDPCEIDTEVIVIDDDEEDNGDEDNDGIIEDPQVPYTVDQLTTHGVVSNFSELASPPKVPKLFSHKPGTVLVPLAGNPQLYLLVAPM